MLKRSGESMEVFLESPLFVVGVGHAYGNVVIDNQFIESLGTETTDEWIREKIGIIERRITLPLDYIQRTKNLDPSKARAHRTKSWLDLAVESVTLACKRANVTFSQINLGLLDCVTPDTYLPTPSQTFKARLGCQGVFVDVTTACPAVALHGFILSLLNYGQLPQYSLATTAATVSHAVNYTDRTDGAIWGDGAASMILSKQETDSGVCLKVLYASFDADTTRASSVVIERVGHFKQDGRAVRNFSVRQTVKMIKEVKSKFNLDFSRDVFIGHQANETMLNQIADACEIPEGNHWKNVVRCGNQAAAGALASLSENWERIKEGQHILIAVLGAGLTWGTLLLQAVRGVR